MAMTLLQLEEELLKLSDIEKKQLLRRLITELDEGSDKDVMQSWLEEAQRRYKELIDGSVRAIPSEETITGARERLKDVR